jgi:hypothetical protein
VHFSKDHLGTESDRNRTRALKSRLFLALSVVTRSATCARLKAAAKGEVFSANLRIATASGARSDRGMVCHDPDPTDAFQKPRGNRSVGGELFRNQRPPRRHVVLLPNCRRSNHPLQINERNCHHGFGRRWSRRTQGRFAHSGTIATCM